MLNNVLSSFKRSRCSKIDSNPSVRKAAGKYAVAGAKVIALFFSNSQSIPTSPDSFDIGDFDVIGADGELMGWRRRVLLGELRKEWRGESEREINGKSSSVEYWGADDSEEEEDEAERPLILLLRCSLVGVDARNIW